MMMKINITATKLPKGCSLRTRISCSILMDPGPASLGEYLGCFDIPNPLVSPVCNTGQSRVFPAKQLSAGARRATFARGKRWRQPLNTFVGSRRLIHIFKRRPTRYTCGMPRCILLTLILLVFRMAMTIFKILIIRSGLVARHI